MMHFSAALIAVSEGYRIARASWQDTGEYIFLVNGSQFAVSRPPLLGMFKEGTVVTYRPHLDKRNADGSIGVWTCTQEDLFAEDWEWFTSLNNE